MQHPLNYNLIPPSGSGSQGLNRSSIPPSGSGSQVLNRSQIQQGRLHLNSSELDVGSQPESTIQMTQLSQIESRSTLGLHNFI